tara:strand:+ start:1810 stop:2208 length:399 start_codon:yes stop_codon:yes gene_type:complete
MDITNKKGFIKLHAFDWSVKDGKMRVVLALFEDHAEIESIKHYSSDPKEKPTTLQKIKQYAKAEASLLLNGAVDEEIYEARISLCGSCEHLIASNDPVGHCNECGCGTRKRAGLTIKCKMPEATCPKNKWKK